MGGGGGQDYNAWFEASFLLHAPGWLNKLLNLRLQSRNIAACPFVLCTQLRVAHRRGVLFVVSVRALPSPPQN